MPLYQFRRSQVVRASPRRVWEFLSSPRNLREITPPALGFEILLVIRRTLERIFDHRRTALEKTL